MKSFERLTTRFLINKKVFLLITLISLLLVLTNYSIGKSEGINNILLSPFIGYGAGFLWLPRWSIFAMVYLMSTYTIGVFVEKIKNSKVIPYIIRFGNKKRWLKEIESTMLKGVFLLLVIYGVISLLVGTILYTKINLSMIKEGCIYFILWAFELIAMSELFLALVICLKSTLISFFIMFVGYYSVSLPLPKIYLNPFGMSCFMRISTFPHGFTNAIIIEISIMILIFIISRIILFTIGRNKILQ